MWTLERYLSESRGGRTAVLLTVPLFVLYEGGLLLVASGKLRNAADLLLREWFGVLGTRGTALLNAVVLALFVVALIAQRKDERPVFGLLPAIAVESALYAMVLIPVVSFVRRLAHLSAGAGFELPLGEAFVLGVGAGLYEELFFRLGLIAGGYLLLRRLFGVDPIWAAVVPLIASSVAFSAFHHMGALGEPWDPQIFAFRFLAGIFLGLLFVYRGLAVACWTHAIYDTLWLLT